MSKELVKDRVVEYLIKELAVPEDKVEMDVPLSEYEDGVEGVIDITVVVNDDDEGIIPLMVVQCLDDDIEMDEDLIEGHMDMLELISSTTGVERLILTNGDQMMYLGLDSEGMNEEELPDYEKMVKEFEESEREYLEYISQNPEHDCEH